MFAGFTKRATALDLAMRQSPLVVLTPTAKEDDADEDPVADCTKALQPILASLSVKEQCSINREDVVASTTSLLQHWLP